MRPSRVAGSKEVALGSECVYRQVEYGLCLNPVANAVCRYGNSSLCCLAEVDDNTLSTSRLLELGDERPILRSGIQLSDMTTIDMHGISNLM